MPSERAAGERATFTPEEARDVLGEFAAPAPRRVREYRRGSARSPKALVECVDGSRYLLKRRNLAGAGADRVNFCHAVHAELVRLRFPVPRLVPVSDSGATWLERGTIVYELFEFIDGAPFDRSLGEALEAGQLLARWHRTLESWDRPEAAPDPLFHRSPAVESAWARLDSRGRAPAAGGSAMDGTRAELMGRMADAASLADSHVAIPGAPAAAHVLHGDFHPGNVLYHAGFPSAVLDLDSARIGHRLLDVANAAMQFSLEPLGDGPEESWPTAISMPRLESFLRGYAIAPSLRLVESESRALPALMVEASIAESVPRIARSGSFGHIDGAAFLRHVNRKTEWIWERRETVTTLCMRCMESA
jgi:Ser/Thr protein kinase RdoA (MazF antagonist)